jgi:hypothetical protein
MRAFNHALIAAFALALAGGAGAALSTPANAYSVRVGVDTGYGYKRGYTERRHYRSYNYYSHRPNRYYYYNYRYERPRYYRGYGHYKRRDFLNCRWVPGEGRVCW